MPEAASHQPSVDAVLSQYPSRYTARRVEPYAGPGGFSGARLWIVATEGGPLCLRRWPRGHPQPERLRFIHDVLIHVAQHGFREIPVPLRDRQGNSFVRVEGALWELTPWLPGQADFHHCPDRGKLVNALEALARFHQAAASFPQTPQLPRPSPGIEARHRQLRALTSGGLTEVAQAVQSHTGDDLRRRGTRIIELFRQAADDVARSLEAACQGSVPLQPCIRDIWHDHVLYTGSRVSGLVDFGAMQLDNVACDIARLLGSLVGDARDERRAGLDSYQTIRELSAEERVLVDVFDQSSLLLSGIHWLHWLCVERRQFGELGRILERLDQTIARLETRLRTGGLLFP